MSKTGFTEGETKKAYCEVGDGVWEIRRASDSGTNKEFTLHLKPWYYPLPTRTNRKLLAADQVQLRVGQGLSKVSFALRPVGSFAS